MNAHLTRRPQTPSGDLMLPSVALTALGSILRREAGAPAATQALHSAGHATGVAFFDALNTRSDDALAELTETAFWKEVEDAFRGWGWGTLRHRRIHSGLGLLSTRDGAEAEASHDPHGCGCPFTAGLLVGFLERAAGRSLSVLEVSCRLRGDDECRFVFGSEQAVQGLYELLLDGLELDRALTNL